MAVQVRRGDYTDFDTNKLLPGEWAAVTSGDPNANDGKAVYMAFAAGDVKRMATYEDMVDNIDRAAGEVINSRTVAACGEAIQDCQTASQDAEAAKTAATTAAGAASAAATAANNAKSAADQAAQRANTAAANAEAAAGDDISNKTVVFSEASARADIESGESAKTLFGKIKKIIRDIKQVAFSGSYNDLSDKPDFDGLSENLKNIIVTVRVSGSVTVPANGGAVNNDVTVADYVPDGYKALCAIPNSTGNNGLYFYNTGLAANGKFYIQLRNVTSSAITATATWMLLCIRDLQ